MKKKLMSIFTRVLSLISCGSFLIVSSLLAIDTKTTFLEQEICKLPISDWKNPTLNDYMLIQRQLYANVLYASQKPIEERGFFSDLRFSGEYFWVVNRMSRLRLIDEQCPYETKPQFEIITFNNPPEKKDKCIICYSSWPIPNRNYGDIDNIIETLKTVQFDGHLIYRKGGWPNPSKERLKYADVPYSFKPFFVEEAKDLGYKNILWLDTCAVPVKSLEKVFAHLDQNGFCFFPGSPGVIPNVFIEARAHVINELNIDRGIDHYDLCARILGFNVYHPDGAKLLNLWIEAAEKKNAYFNGNPEQTVLCFLLNSMNIYNQCELPMKYYWEGNATEWEKIPPAVFDSEAIFYFSYPFVENRHMGQNLQGSYPKHKYDTFVFDSLKEPQYITDYFTSNKEK